MSKPKFTPGPWVAEQDGGKGSWVKGVTGEWAALSCGDTDESANANAHLIAAAPVLYAALDELVSTIIIDDDEGLATFLDPIQRAQAALAMARGE